MGKDILLHAAEPYGRSRPPGTAEARRGSAETLVTEVPEPLQPLYRFSANQGRGHLDVISRFGRYPHRNPLLGRISTPEEAAYLEKGEFVHTRRPPDS